MQYNEDEHFDVRHMSKNQWGTTIIIRERWSSSLAAT